MFTQKCDKCSRVFQHETNKSAQFALAMHLSRAHGIRGEKAERNRRARIARKERQKLAATEVKTKRKYVRKPAAQEYSLVQFCPRCGCNLHAVSVAIRMQG